jgi:hypothetical protein
MWALGVAFILLTIGVFTIPIEQLPHTTATSFRTLIGLMLVIAAGVFFGQLFVCFSH